MSRNHKVTQQQTLLDRKGHIAEQGWSDRPVWTYSRKAVHAGKLRIKEWDYYAVHSFSGSWTVCVTVSDLGYAALFSVSFIDYAKGGFAQRDITKLLPLGRTGLAPSSSEDSSFVFQNHKMRIALIKKGTKRHLLFNVPDLVLPDGRTGLDVNITLTQSAALRSMNIATSWAEKRKAFYLNQKINCMPASGTVRLGDDTTYLSKDDAWGVLDWGRGVWTRENTWYWGSASGIAGGGRFGFNIGYGFSDRTPASENCLFFNGSVHKLDDVTFILPEKSFTDPWKFTSSDGRFEMTFMPAVDRSSDTRIPLVRSIQHQVFGYYTGDAVLDGGEVIHIEDFPGFAEKVYNKW